MNKINLYLLLLITIFPILGCQKSIKSTTQLDNKSYINDFELLQENPINKTVVKVISPKAIFDPSTNDIEIFNSTIEILNNRVNDIQVKSGNSTFNNLSNFIKVYNQVNISFLDNDDFFIRTNSFKWDLNTSFIDIDNPLDINFDNTKIIATNGLYNIDSSLLRIDNTEFNRNVYNPDGKEEYQVKIKSDFAKWYKIENKLVFISNDRQVETTINFLTIK